MFVALMEWVGTIEDGAWVTTGDSVNFDRIERITCHESDRYANTYFARARFDNGGTCSLFVKAPSLGDLYALIGTMLDATNVGRWPPPDLGAPRLVPPGDN